MSESWYCLVFGAELGPMSWDDLVLTVSRGDVGPNDRVRRGTDGDWRPASSLEGLLTAAAASRAAATSSSLADDPAATAWYCEVFGAELGPMPSSDLQDMARRGALGLKNRVRRERSAHWVAAETVESLELRLAAPAGNIAQTTAPEDDTGFEIDVPAPDDYAPAVRAGPDETETVSGPPRAFAPAVPPPAPVRPAPPIEAAPPALSTSVEEKPDQQSQTKKTDPKQPDAKKPGKTKPEKKKPEKKKAEKKKSSGARVGLEISPGQIKALLGLVGVGCLLGLGYLGYLSLVSKKSAADYPAILAGYDRLHGEISTFRQNHGAGITPNTQKQFLDALATLRQPLEKAEPGSINDRLYKAGTHLLEMLANAGAAPESEADLQYTVSEKSYRDLLTSTRGELGL